VDYLFAILLGIVQGLTEFLPISSTGHLIIGERLLGLDPNTFGLGFDAAIQLGTTAAVIFFFRKDLGDLVRNWRRPAERRLLWLLGLATIPALLIGKALESQIEGPFRSLGVIIVTLVVGAVVFLVVERVARTRKTVAKVTKIDAVIIGLAQSLALVPGVSRSGATIVAGMLLGLERAAAARFTFLLSVPVITIAGLKKLYDVSQGGVGGRLDLIGVGLVTAAIIGFFTIKYLLRFLARNRLDVFAYYRLALAGVLVLILLGR
jgi:undecaprenyl-diphosphatase